MMDFIIYNGKVAAVLLVFYLFYRQMLRKETFHRFNRIVLAGTAVMSFLLPLCIITLNVPAWQLPDWVEQAKMGHTGGIVGMPEIVQDISFPTNPEESWWMPIICIIYWCGAAFVLVRIMVSVLSILKIVHGGRSVSDEDGSRIIVTEREIEPFSWMKYIVLSKEDWDRNHVSVLVHEKAHVKYGHSAELMLVDVLAALQWFNPAVWMLRSDLQDLHEFEADDAVLRSRTDIKEYQYLLIRKAVGKSGYSVANSFNHSILKKRITMMSKSRSPLSRRLRLLYVLPLVCLCLGLQAQTVSESSDKINQKSHPLYILRYAWGEEKQISKAELDEFDQQRISSVKVLKDAEAKEKYGDKASNGVIVLNVKLPQEMDKLTVVSYKENEDETVPFYIIEPDTMPSFGGEGINGFSKWLFSKIYRPQGCTHQGTMKVSFVVDKDGSVKDVTVRESVCGELDNMVISIIGKSPKWEPATLNGKPVEQHLRLPISFEMR